MEDATAVLGTVATVARSLRREVLEIGLLPSQDRRHSNDRITFELYDALVTCGPVREASRSLFLDGYFTQAVGEAVKRLNDEVKRKANRFDIDGASLMQTVFSANSPSLRLNEMQSTSDRDEQLGYMQMYAGVMTGVRNPRAHDVDVEDSADVALELLIVVNHLMRRLDEAVGVDSP